MRSGRGVVLAVVVCVVAALGACSSDGGDDATPTTTSTTIPAPDPDSAPIEAHGGTGQIWLRTDPGVEVELRDADGELVPTEVVDGEAEITAVDSRTTDDQGALVLRYVEPGDGYVVVRTDDPGTRSEPLTVTAIDEHPEPSAYEGQEIGEGYGYLTTRDGTRLSINVTLPGPVEDGPYPTVIEYSGYDPSNPSPSLVTISKTIASQQGFATVGVNVRGSGCSGGSMQLWEDAQATDGYDAVETIAAQPWVEGGRVGMVGISYPATAMLYTAALQPPSLAAIAPMASYDDGFRALLWPGGIQNEGFAREWVEGRYTESDPANVPWVQQRIDEGDEVCAENVEMRGQNLDLAALIDAMPHYPEIYDLGDRFAPATFVDRIEVPTFLVASWQDEQVGGHAPTMLPAFSGVPEMYVTLVNGYHAEGLANPTVLQRWLEFLQLYVAEDVPSTDGLADFSEVISGQVTGDAAAAAALPWPASELPTSSYEDALAAFEAQDRVRVLFDNGAGPGVAPGMPLHGFEHTTSAYPLPGTEATTWYLGPDGTLVEEPPTAADDADGTVDAFTADPSNRPADNLPDGQDPWWRLPAYDWQPPVPGTALGYATEPLAADTVMVGSGSVDLWVRSSEPDTDLQVTLTEIRPDGQETYVQSGWLRLSKRALDEDLSTELQPIPSLLEGDAAPLADDEYVEARIEIYPFAHAFRAGSRVRLIVSAPGADRPVWSFVTLDGTQEDEIARSADRPSAVVLPVVPGIEVPTPLPPCPALRGQPCRPYEELANA